MDVFGKVEKREAARETLRQNQPLLRKASETDAVEKGEGKLRAAPDLLKGEKILDLLVFLHRKFHGRADLAIELHGNVVFPHQLDRISENDLPLLDVVALRRERF